MNSRVEWKLRVPGDLARRVDLLQELWPCSTSRNRLIELLLLGAIKQATQEPAVFAASVMGVK